jgi:hypothetical protein
VDAFRSVQLIAIPERVMAITTTLAKNAGLGEVPPRAVHVITIAEGQKASQSFYLSGETIEGVFVPAGFTTGDLQLEVSVDGTTFVESDGAKIAGAVASKAYALPAGVCQGLYARFVSSVNQAAAVNLTVLAAQ